MLIYFAGENIFKLIDQELLSRHISWKNNLALGCDNASVMTGGKKGVIAFCQEKNGELYLAGCTLHLVHIAARKAYEVLPPIDDVMIDITILIRVIQGNVLSKEPRKCLT